MFTGLSGLCRNDTPQSAAGGPMTLEHGTGTFYCGEASRQQLLRHHHEGQHRPSKILLTLTAAVLVGACHRQAESPTAPNSSQTTASSSGSACAYTIAGLITAYQGGPLANAGIQVVPYPYGSGTSTKTDSAGRYSVCGPSASKVGLQVYAKGYATAFKYDVQAHDQTLNFALREAFEVPVGGGTGTAVIRGDELEAGDDYFGGACERSACKIVDLSYSGCPCPNRNVEITLQWANPSSHLALYFSKADIYFPPAYVPPGTRYCCSSPLVATYMLNADFDRFAIGFEDIGAVAPGSADTQAFDLTVRPLP
jgi:hypothetical protein